MKSIKNTLRLCRMAIKMQPFFLVYGIVSTVIGLFHMLFPIAIVGVIVHLYEQGEGILTILYVCSAFALGFYLINITSFLLNKYYNRIYRVFRSKYEKMIFEKLNVIDYEMYQSSSFLNDYTKALDNGSGAILNSWWDIMGIISNIISVATVFTIFSLLNPIIIVYAIIVGIIFFFLSKYNAKLSWNLGEIQKQNYRHRGYIKRMFYLKDASEDIRTSNIKDLFLGINDEVGDKVIKNTDKYLSKRGIVSFIMNLLTYSIYPVALGFVGYVYLGTTSIAIFSALVVAAGSLSNTVNNLSDSFASLETNSIEGETVFRILNKIGIIEVSGSKDCEELKTLEVRNLSFAYGEKKVLEEIDFKIKKGEKIAIVGENGAGKTTFVKLLLRLYDPINGEVNLNDDNYLDLFPMSIRKRIGAVFQEYEAYAFTIAENVILRKVETIEDEELVKNSLTFSGLYDKVAKLPNGINTVVSKEFAEDGIVFSGGERQKLAIARAFAGDFDLIILDEPSSALDPIAEADMYNKIMKLGEDKTLIFISHRLSTTMKADRIYLFENGKVAEVGTHHELMSIENGKYRYMFNIQAKNYVEGSAV